MSLPRSSFPNLPHRLLLIASCLAALFASTGQLNAADLLAEQFAAPPESARPWVYWFWLNGNITREGITADLEAMKRAGIAGALIMEVDQGAPVGPVDFMSPSWRELFQFVHEEANRLGLEINMNDDAGWNGSGGPWIKPEEAMQEVTWTETRVAGPQRFEGELPQPEARNGYYRDIAVQAFPSVGPYRIPGLRSKAAYQRREVGEPGSGPFTPEMAIGKDAVVDLTAKMDGEGKLVWEVPQGKWTILRLGHTCTGVQNAPAPATGRGLECDKLSPEGIEAQFAGMMAKLAADTGIAAQPAKAGLVATHIDSWENGSQNWTRRMPEEFRQRRGYDMMPFLPVLTGRVAQSEEISERFLQDLRRTVSELVVENYAGRFCELAHGAGMRFTVEAYGGPCDHIPYGGRSDEPMGEFWTPRGGAMATCRGMASAGHVYGKPVIGAEAFTANDHERWQLHPAMLKALGDQAFCEGINRFVFHRYAMQPWIDRRPGMTMGPWGQHYERTQTWWDQTPAWHDYLARCQLLLRQGLFAADVCFLRPETSPQGFGRYPLDGYGWDECTDDAVLNRMSVRDGRIVLPDGMNYRLLVLSDTRSMTPRLLEKIKELVEAGATVLGPRPLKSPSLSDYPQCDQEVERLAAELWGPCDGKEVKENRIGQGRISWGLTPEAVLTQDGLGPDFACDRSWRFIHRSSEDGEIYFVASDEPFEATATCAFRVTGRVPELWCAETGSIRHAAVWEEEDAVTRVSLTLGPSGSAFVVFRESSGGADPIVRVARDGKTLLSAAMTPPPEIVVRKARYGVLDDPQRTRDVTEKVQQQVDKGDREFTVSKMAEGDDPAYGIVKTLVIDYTVEGKPLSVKAQDPETIRLAGDAVNVTIEKAAYGVLTDPKRTRDVREKLQRLVDAGCSSFTVSLMARGDDPAYHVVKTLDVEYTMDGERRHLTGTDPDVLSFFDPVVPPPAAVQLRCDKEGRLLLDAREAGRYELTTSSGRVRQVDVKADISEVEIDGPWQVSFDPKWGGPKQAAFEQLKDWAEREEDGIRYYSGTAVYRKTFTYSPSPGKPRVLLDLGSVEVIAEVRLNGKDLGTLWKPPYRVDVTDAIRPGANALEVKVVNLWINRMIGDEQLPEDSDRNSNGTLRNWPEWLQEGKPSPTGRYTFTSWRLWKKDDPLAPSGLIGPVRLESVDEVVVNDE